MTAVVRRTLSANNGANDKRLCEKRTFSGAKVLDVNINYNTSCFPGCEEAG